MNEGTSARAALQLVYEGFEAAALKGGLNAWREKYDVEPAAAPAA